MMWIFLLSLYELFVKCFMNSIFVCCKPGYQNDCENKRIEENKCSIKNMPDTACSRSLCVPYLLVQHTYRKVLLLV